MIEMELKALLKDKLLIKRRIEEYGCTWLPICLQLDTIYEKNDKCKIINTPIFRIRKCDDKTILTLKILEEDLDTAEELELEIGDDRIMDKILQTMDFSPKVQIVKRRQQTKYRGFNICIDEVEELGDFIEIEMVSEKSVDKDIIYRKMRKVLLELGVKEKDFRRQKYFEILLDKKGKEK